MYNSNRAVFCIALFIAFVGIGSCLQCHHCISKDDPKCEKPWKSNLKTLDCASPESVAFNKDKLYDVLPSDVFGGTKGAPRYCHKVTIEIGTVIRTCLHGSATNVNETCNTLIDSTKSSSTDKKVVSCETYLTYSKDVEDLKSGAEAISMSLRLSALTLVVTYVLLKQ